MSRLFKDDEMRGTKKIQTLTYLYTLRVWIFCSDEADRLFGQSANIQEAGR